MKRSVKLLAATLAGSVLAGLPLTLTFAQSAPSTSSPTSTPAANLRAGLDQLLGEHAMTLELRMQALAQGNKAQYQALTTTMNQDTTALTNAVSSIYGQKGGQEFESLWNQHKYFFSYAKAYVGEQQSQALLTHYKNEFAQFMATANPNLRESTLSTVLQDHINQITTAFNDAQTGHPNQSWAQLVTDYNLMYTAGGYLAAGIDQQFPAQFKDTSTLTPAVNLQVALDQLLGEHAIVLEQAMQADYAGNTALFNALMKVMDNNTAQLTQAIASVYGTQAGQEFSTLWNKHVYFFDYVNAVKAHNVSAEEAAQNQLTFYKNQFAQFLATANPNFSESTLSSVLQEHINQITTAFNDYVSGNYLSSENEMVQAYNLMYTAGAYLSQGIAAQFPQKFDNSTVGTPAGNLRVALDQLLGEHAMILELRMQALGAGNTALYNALSDVMTQNTQALTNAITSIYGNAGGQEFETLWNKHMYFFTYAQDFVNAQKAQAQLTFYKNEFAKFMATANPQLSEATLSSVLQEHINQITAAFNDFDQGNDVAADQELVAAYNLMFTAGDYLATGISNQFPSQFPTSPNTPAANLQAGLDQLLGEHAFILELRMQALSAHQMGQYQALTTIMNQNTQALTAAISSIYGAQAGQKFESLWNKHMYFFTYENAVLANNSGAAQQAQATLTHYKSAFAAFMAGANPNLSKKVLSSVLQTHINQISQSWLDFNQGNDSASDALLVQDYGLMFDAAHYLATGIVAQFPQKFGKSPAPITSTTPLPVIPKADINDHTNALQHAQIDGEEVYFRANQYGIYSESLNPNQVYNPAQPTT
ncbi:hypothetical protein SAMN00768000_2599 [Sulfobacillus thermosulfidooxidans DSM 9293]|uniref:Uncharacterized protein n=1 Tax=Sulfobacillus thermosulfidooxidans (strain DSM 9293 / VKM B-1269 / AT-1) TaxID=929705 RepID=A0A1W1WIF3_SULTA|nr:hypothetical protein [Sulfobacillus thermosulfidooxidans]SMC06036.1 hypothetical protein SAMN00768000_2599 [Sulfobacillus thermosulfidooxidans DSM 9293]